MPSAKPRSVHLHRAPDQNPDFSVARGTSRFSACRVTQRLHRSEIRTTRFATLPGSSLPRASCPCRHDVRGVRPPWRPRGRLQPRPEVRAPPPASRLYSPRVEISRNTPAFFLLARTSSREAPESPRASTHPAFVLPRSGARVPRAGRSRTRSGPGCSWRWSWRPPPGACWRTRTSPRAPTRRRCAPGRRVLGAFVPLRRRFGRERGAVPEAGDARRRAERWFRYV